MPGKLGKKIAQLFKKGTKKTKDVLKEIKYNVRDKGTIRDMKWKERNPEETDIMISDEPPVNFEYPTYDAGGRVEEKVIDWDDMENNR